MAIDNKLITIAKTKQEDLEHLFLFQLDKEANYLAAFTPKNPHDQDLYMQKWIKLMNDETINMQTIFVDDLVVGSVVKYEIASEPEITYWIDKRFWGKGIATAALKQFFILHP